VEEDERGVAAAKGGVEPVSASESFTISTGSEIFSSYINTV